MEKAKEAAVQFFGRSDVFAEVFNHVLGKKLVPPEALQDLEGVQIREGGKPFHVPEERDLMRLWVKDGKSYCILALGLAYKPVYPTEMRYRDALTFYDEFGTVYEDWAAAAAEARKIGPFDGSVLLTDLILCAPKGEKLIPVISATVNLAPKAWDTPTTIAEMVGIPELAEENQYEMHLLDPFKTADDVCRQFQTELRSVLPMLKHRGNPAALEACFGGDPPCNLSPEAVALLRTHGYPDDVPGEAG